MQYFLNDWLKKKGHGFIGAHSAADTMADYKPYWDMIGGSFNGHPWNAGEKVTVTVHDTQHPISKPWGEEFEIQDEIYRFKNWQPEKVRVLMSLNMAKTKRKEPYHVPIAWCKEYGDGKALHMSLGHNDQVWENEKYMDSMLGGIKWILGHGEGRRHAEPRAVARLKKRKPRPTPRPPSPRGSERVNRFTASVSIHERDSVAIVVLRGRRVRVGNLCGRAAPPNVVLILCDDLGYAELGCYGQQKIRTPNIDRMAREGMRFTQYYSGSPVCAPRAACC